MEGHQQEGKVLIFLVIFLLLILGSIGRPGRRNRGRFYNTLQDWQDRPKWCLKPTETGEEEGGKAPCLHLGGCTEWKAAIKPFSEEHPRQISLPLVNDDGGSTLCSWQRALLAMRSDLSWEICDADFLKLDGEGCGSGHRGSS